jgi:hypothetical protein
MAGPGVGWSSAWVRRPHTGRSRLNVEYKQSQPCARLILPNTGIVRYLCEQIGLDNVGVTVDLGHALYVNETPAQVIRLAHDAGRIFLVHINDNYRNTHTMATFTDLTTFGLTEY